MLWTRCCVPGRRVESNRIRIFGFTAGEIVGQKVHRTFTERDVDAGVPDRESAKTLNEAVEAIYGMVRPRSRTWW